MTVDTYSPSRWAIELSKLLNTVLGPDHFPIDVADVAKEYSRQRYPDDPITLVKGAPLPGFEGALYRAPDGKKGWGIIYNDSISSPGRINFTLAHEFGHYLLHRRKFPDGKECGEQDLVRWDSEYGQIEAQANEYAATFLMPLDDFRRQISSRDRPHLDEIGACADRYRVSLIAATLRWLQYTSRRAILVISRDGFILWARSSKPALKSGAYYRTANRPPIPIPAQSLAAQRHAVDDYKGERDLEADTWLREPCREIVIFSEKYDFTISLLHLDNAPIYLKSEKAPEPDIVDRMRSRTPGSSWLD